MTKQSFFIIVLILIGIFSCKQPDSNYININLNNSAVSLDSIIYKNYVEAVQNDGTFGFFLVAKIKDKNTGIIREICTKGGFLEGALHMEYKIDYDKIGILKIKNIEVNNRTRFFELKDTAALKNLALDEYSMDDLVRFEKSYNIDSLVHIINKGNWRMKIWDDKMMRLYAHSLFNKGILTGENSCYGGTLISIDDKFLFERKKREEEIQRLIDSTK